MASRTPSRTAAYAARTLNLGVYASGALVALGLATGADTVVKAGIFILIATPLLRVAIVGLGYAVEGRWRWAGVSALVLAAVALGAALGARH